MVKKVKVLLVLGAFALASAASAQVPLAPPTAKCSIAKMKCASAFVKAELTCLGKTAKLGALPPPKDEATCLAKAESKWSNGTNTGCIQKAEALYPSGCAALGGTDAGLKADADAIIAAYQTQMYPSHPAIDLCAAGLMKCATGLYVGLEACDAKAINKGTATTGNVAGPPPGCQFKTLTKFTTPLKGCVDKLTAAGKACAAAPPAQVDAAAAIATTNASLNKTECQQMPDARPATSGPDGIQIVLQPGGGNCGTTDGAVNPNLTCGTLYIGDGSGTTPPGATPAGSITKFDLAGGLNRVCPRTAAEEGGSLKNCTDIGCFFGSPLPIVNGGLSTCVNNSFVAQGYGTVDNSTGSFTGDVLLQSAVTVTGNPGEPCPLCVAGLCDGTAVNAGAACVADATSGQSHDCVANGVALSPFAVSLTGLTTGTAEKQNPGGIFCPSQANAGAFGDAAVTDIKTTGTNGPAVEGTVFCIPATGNVLIDGAAGLPGPGATTLPVVATQFTN